MPTVERKESEIEIPEFEKKAAGGKTIHEKSPENWEQKTMEKLLFASLTEQRRQRRWGIFFKGLFFAYLIFGIWLFLPSKPSTIPQASKAHVALINIKGIIIEDEVASADNIAGSLRAAFENEYVENIILRINSPGGSPVQSAYIFNEIQRLKEKHPKKTVYAVCTDVCASAAYFIAAASDHIYANPMSIIGSIGVVFNGFGFVDTIEKIGVERRLMTAGKYKGMLDPFSPTTTVTTDMTQTMLDSVHQVFIDKVIEGRGEKINPRNQELFSGRFWMGTQAIDLGLIDGFQSAGGVARDIIKNENIIDYTQKPNYLELFARRFGASFASSISSVLGIAPSGLKM